MTRHRASFLLAVAVLGLGAAPALALPEGWSAPASLSSARVSGLQPWAAANARGDLAVAWRARTRAGETVQVARRPAGASAFSAPITITLPTVSVQGVRVALSAQGRVLVGWRSKDSARRSTVNAAFISAAGTRIRTTSYPGAKDASGAVNVVFTPTGSAAVGWVANSRAIQNAVPGVFDGRAMIALARPGRTFGAARRLDPKPPKGGVFCANESGTDLAARAVGGVLAWWDCDEDVRDFQTTATEISPTGVIAKSRLAGAVSRGPSFSAIQPTPAGTAMGVQSVNNDDDAGPNVGTMRRSPAGKWTDGVVTIAGVENDPFFPPHILGRPRVAAASGVALSAWEGDDGKVTAMTGSTATAAWDPATVLPTTGDDALVAGVGVTTAHSLQVVFTTRPAPGLARTLWSARRLATEAAFAAPEDALHISQLTGEPAFVLGRGGRGVVVYSEGPKTAARVRAVVVAVP